MKSKKTLQIVSLVIILCFVLTSTVFALSPENGMQYDFARNDFKNDNFGWNKSAIFMRDKGIMNGYGNGDFGFEDYVKRGDVTLMIVRAFQISTIFGDIEKKFPDVPIESYYYDAIATAKHYGIAKGDGKHFNPKKYVTIKEAILLIERAAKVANSNVVVYEDADLDKIYKGKDIEKYATRDDIAQMLYYVLTGDTYDENDENDESEDKEVDVVVYETKENDEVTFDEDDFKAAFDDFDNTDKDDELVYVKFDIPASKYGKLFYDYDEDDDENLAVKSTYKCYTDDSSNSYRKISKVTFVPYKNYTGTFYMEYTAYDENENEYPGKIKIVVKDDASTLKNINYTFSKNTNLTFEHEDFKTVYDDVINDDFDYIEFTIPDDDYGILYYNYNGDKTTVKADNNYDLDDLDKITFVPHKDYAGTFYINYTVYDKNEDSYKGKINMVVKNNVVVLKTINFVTEENTKYTFVHADFEKVFDAATDNNCDYLSFTLPDTNKGVLYYDYDSTKSDNTKVKSDDKYELDDLDNITFVPYKNYDNNFYINYKIYDKESNEYQGKILIIFVEY